MMMKYLLILALFLAIPGLALDKKGAPDTDYHGEQKTLKGTIEKIPFKNKVGKEVKGIYDYNFKTKSGTYHINLHESSVTEAEMKQLVGEKIKVSATIKDGLWDTDDPNVQSRVGEHIVIHEVL